MKYHHKSEWVIKFNNLSWTADSAVHVIHISCVIITYALESLLPSYKESHFQLLSPILLSSNSSKAWVNTLRPRQDGHPFPDDIFKRIFLNENVWILIIISMKLVPKVRINNNPALVQIMAWRWLGDKPLSESMVVSFLTQICVTRPQWVNHCYKSILVTFFNPFMIANVIVA